MDNAVTSHEGDEEMLTFDIPDEALERWSQFAILHVTPHVLQMRKECPSHTLRLRLQQQHRQLGDIRRDLPRLCNS
jgi:hypothetical protein